MYEELLRMAKDHQYKMNFLNQKALEHNISDINFIFKKIQTAKKKAAKGTKRAPGRPKKVKSDGKV